MSNNTRFYTYRGVPSVAQQVTNPTAIHEDESSIPSLAQWVKDLALLWLWCRPVSTALIRPVAWEPPYATGAALERQKRKRKKRDCSWDQYLQNRKDKNRTGQREKLRCDAGPTKTSGTSQKVVELG